jgi:signal transduction histidine kinase
VTTLTQVLEVNWIILYFIYGQVFFVTGLVTGLQWRRRSDLALARPLPWLAAFGIGLGFYAWGHIFIPLQVAYLPDTVVGVMVLAHLMLLAGTFFFLLQFGVELALPLLPRLRWLRAVPSALLVLWGVSVFLRGTLAQDPIDVLFAIGDGWARYLLCLPGALLASIGLFHQAHQMRKTGLPRIGTYLAGAAVAFLVYALVGGLVVPSAPIFPADRLNYPLLNHTLHIPVPLIRSLCGLAIAFFIVRSLQVFGVEADRRMERMERAQLLAADRERIGRELHDGIIQNIYAAGLKLEDARHLVVEEPRHAQERIGAVMEALNRAIEDIRRYIFDLGAAENTREIERVLEALVQDLRLDTLLELELEVSGQRCCWLEPQAVDHIRQVAREALSNVVQHAEATHVMVRLDYGGDITRLTISDDGQGLAPRATSNGAFEGRGIENMRARARMMGGELLLHDDQERGFGLELVIPCSSLNRDGAELEAQEPWA